MLPAILLKGNYVALGEIIAFLQRSVNRVSWLITLVLTLGSKLPCGLAPAMSIQECTLGTREVARALRGSGSCAWRAALALYAMLLRLANSANRAAWSMPAKPWSWAWA